MGYRAHQRTVSKVKYANRDDFNWCMEGLYDIIKHYCEQSNLSDETGYPANHWEIHPDDLKKLIKEFKGKENYAFEDYTYNDICEIFEQWLKTYYNNKENLDDFIEIDWF